MLNKRTLYFGYETQKRLIEWYERLNLKPPTESLICKSVYNLSQIKNSIKRYEALVELDVDEKYDVVVIDDIGSIYTEDRDLSIRNNKINELILELTNKFEKVIIIKNIRRTPISINQCSEIELPPMNTIIPSFKENKINFNGISTDMDTFTQKYKRYKNINELLNH
jgi:hypothetical protein